MSEPALEMHAARRGTPEVLQPRQVQLAPPGAGEVRVAIEAAGVAYADVVMRQGWYPEHSPPVTPGYDFVGRITALGPQVNDFSVGQRVAAVTISGSYATQRNVATALLVPAPEHTDAVTLTAAVLNGLTAWQMLQRIVTPEAGEWLLVHGAAGGVGSLLVDLACLAGARCIGTASRGKHAVITARGAVALDHREPRLVDAIKSLSGGGVIAAFDHIGGNHLRKISMRALLPGGIAVLYGFYNANRDGRFNPLAGVDLLLNARLSSYQLFNRAQGVVGYSAPIWRDQRQAAYRSDLANVLQLVATGKLQPLVGATFPLQRAAEAHRALETRAVSGKIVLIP